MYFIRVRSVISSDVENNLLRIGQEALTNPELSDRELEVLPLIAQGMSNLGISAALRIGESSVKTHINRILSKLNVKDRTQAAIVALKRGIVNF